jgi:hypothetical protein
MIYYSLLLPLSPPPYLENTIHMRTHTQGTIRNKISCFWIDPAFSIQGGKLPGYQSTLAAIIKVGSVFLPAFRSKGSP